MKKEINLEVECPQCGGTGIYSGMAEAEFVGVVCRNCKGTGMYKFKYQYKEFNGRKIKDDIKRVYLPSQYKLGLGIIDFDGIGKIDMNKEGVSYDEFLNGKLPNYIKKLECPMIANQGACHKIKGFVKKCNTFGLGWGVMINSCTNQCNKLECWERFERGNK